MTTTAADREGMGARDRAPADTACDEAWDRIMEIARDHALVVQASGGVATLATAHAQREAGLREKVLRMHCMTEPTEGAA